MQWYAGELPTRPVGFLFTIRAKLRARRHHSASILVSMMLNRAIQPSPSPTSVQLARWFSTISRDCERQYQPRAWYLRSSVRASLVQVTVHFLTNSVSRQACRSLTNPKSILRESDKNLLVPIQSSPVSATWSSRSRRSRCLRLTLFHQSAHGDLRMACWFGVQRCQHRNLSPNARLVIKSHHAQLFAEPLVRFSL